MMVTIFVIILMVTWNYFFYRWIRTGIYIGLTMWVMQYTNLRLHALNIIKSQHSSDCSTWYTKRALLAAWLIIYKLVWTANSGIQFVITLSIYCKYSSFILWLFYAKYCYYLSINPMDIDNYLTGQANIYHKIYWSSYYIFNGIWLIIELSNSI